MQQQVRGHPLGRSALASARASAAAACRTWRSPGARSSYSAARTIGCTNPRRSVRTKMSARTSSSAACLTASSPRPTTRPAISGSMPSPSTATARASSVAPARVRQAGAGRSGSPRPVLPPARHPRPHADGSTAAAWRARSSSCRKSGLPPVAAWHDRQNSSVASVLNSSRTRVSAAGWLNGRGYSTAADGREASCVHSGALSSSSGCGGRAVRSIATGRPSMRWAR